MQTYKNASDLQDFFDKYENKMEKLVETKGVTMPECTDGNLVYIHNSIQMFKFFFK